MILSIMTLCYVPPSVKLLGLTNSQILNPDSRIWFSNQIDTTGKLYACANVCMLYT